METLDVNGVKLSFVDAGRGTPVVLVHGFPLDHRMWEGQIAALSMHCRVLAPDLRGFGRSGATPGTVTMEQMADDLAALLAAVPVTEPVVLAGLSMGGYVAFEFWRKHRARLRGLVLCDTRAGADTTESAAGRLDMAQRVVRDGPAPLLDAMLPRLLAPATVDNHPRVVETLRRMILSGDPQGIAAAARGMARRRDFTGLLPHIDCPTLAIVGRHDVISPPAEMRAMAQAIPGARLVEIEGAGHMAPMEKPAEVNAAIAEFLGPSHDLL